MCGKAHSSYALPALELVNCGSCGDPQTRCARRLRQRSGRGVAQIRDQFDPYPRLMQVERGAISAVMCGDDDDSLTDFDAVLVQIATRRVGEHDARTIIVGENKRALDSPRGEHDFTRPHLPQPLARQIGVGDQIGFSEPFAERDEILREIAESLRARHEPHVRRAAERGDGVGEPLPGALAVDAGVSLGEQRTARRRILVADDDVRPTRSRGKSRSETRRAGADDQNVAMIEIADIAVGVGLRRRVPSPAARRTTGS